MATPDSSLPDRVVQDSLWITVSRLCSFHDVAVRSSEELVAVIPAYSPDRELSIHVVTEAGELWLHDDAVGGHIGRMKLELELASYTSVDAFVAAFSDILDGALRTWRAGAA